MRLRAFAFGDLATGVWGIAATAGELAVASFASEVRVDDARDESLLASAGLELRFAPASEACAFAPAGAGIGGDAQLCTVEGAVHWDGIERDVACLGLRTAIELPAARPASARAAAAWFAPGDGFALVALRRHGARGHDADAVACALIEDGDALDVEEPRFSTTYTGDGLPARAGLELWLAGADEDPSDDDPSDEDPSDHDSDAGDEGGDGGSGAHPRSYPRRAAGERAGDGSHVVTPGGGARAELFRWHARGLDGAGVYLLWPLL